MIGLETSVLVRYLVGTPPAQARPAATLAADAIALATFHRDQRRYGVTTRDL